MRSLVIVVQRALQLRHVRVYWLQVARSVIGLERDGETEREGRSGNKERVLVSRVAILVEQ